MKPALTDTFKCIRSLNWSRLQLWQDMNESKRTVNMEESMGRIEKEKRNAIKNNFYPTIMNGAKGK